MNARNIGVSVVMPAYNASKTIRAAIDSVLCQTHYELELIVVNDCSKDDTEKIVLEYTKKDPRVRLVTNPQNSGVSITRNNGVKKARYELVALLDSDDSWEETKLEKQLDAMSKNPQAAICFTATAYVSEDGERSDYVLTVPERVTYNDVLKQNIVSCSSVMVKRSALLEDPMPACRDIHEDLATWLAILKKTPYAVGVNEPLLIYRVSKNGKSGNKIEAAKMQWRTYRMSKVPFFKAAYCFLVYALRNIKKFRQVKAGMKIYE
ncbi:MAG: glycosyltransferase family 2 protein [Clostridia bacterium]|nr:glycosyltransferase family 2 protein [Clostridia bacterium]